MTLIEILKLSGFITTSSNTSFDFSFILYITVLEDDYVDNCSNMILVEFFQKSFVLQIKSYEEIWKLSGRQGEL